MFLNTNTHLNNMLDTSSEEYVHYVIALMIFTNFLLQMSGDVSDDLLVFNPVQEVELQQRTEELL